MISFLLLFYFILFCISRIQYFVTNYDINNKVTSMVKGREFFWPKQVTKTFFLFW